MKYLLLLLMVIFVGLQYKLWFQKGGVSDVLQLKKQVAIQQRENRELQQRNQVLTAQVKDLKQGNQAVAELARNELGMIKQGEVFYQVVN